MSIRIFRKALGLLIVDIVIIIGIFVLQFRTDSSIIEKFGSLQITLEKIENQQNAVALKNKFMASYNGLTLYCDDKNPVQIVDSNTGNKKAVQLVEWTKLSELSSRFTFTNGVSFILSLSSDSPTATLNTIASLPSDVSDIYIPFNYSYNMKILKDDGNRIVLEGKKSSWEVTASDFSDGMFGLNRRTASASYSAYDATQKFTFDSITELAIAEKDAFDQTLASFKQNLISVYKSNNSEANLTEQSIVSYVAVMAEKGDYTQAIEDIPQSFKKGKQRTYLSAPYFNTLEEMNSLLNKSIAESKQTITKYAENGSLDFFNSRDIAFKLCICDNTQNVKKVLENAAVADTSAITIAQATGIIQSFVDLSSLNPEYAKILLPVLDGCITRITEACAFDGNVLTISENDTFLSVVQAVETGVAILRYGTITGNNTLVKAGRVLVNSYIAESSSFDLRTLANVYPIIAYDNSYYPHYEQIQTDDNRFVWAWTCANSIFYEYSEEEHAITLNIDFPEGNTHYLIIKGLPTFTSIYIYNMAFRTDPRFETYNSSGYVYKADDKTLLLKSRHKSRFETVRMEYDENVAKRRAEAEAAAAEKAAAEAEAAAEGEAKTEESATSLATESIPPSPVTPPASVTNSAVQRTVPTGQMGN